MNIQKDTRRIISLDLSANTHLNDMRIIRRMIDEVAAIDSKEFRVIFKHQLFQSAGANIPLNPNIFEIAYGYAKLMGYESTSSVFDIESLEFLLDFDIPFLKIANNRSLDYLIKEVPKYVPVVASYGSFSEVLKQNPINVKESDVALLCVSRYPCEMKDYEENFGKLFGVVLKDAEQKFGISDHTSNWDLFKTYKPHFLEVHLKLPDSIGLDAGSFSRTPAQLAEILGGH